MQTSDILQLVISGAGVLITLLVIWVASQKQNAVIEERLKAGDKKFDAIERRCKDHSEKLEKIETGIAVDHSRVDRNCADINKLDCRVARLEDHE